MRQGHTHCCNKWLEANEKGVDKLSFLDDLCVLHVKYATNNTERSVCPQMKLKAAVSYAQVYVQWNILISHYQTRCRWPPVMYNSPFEGTGVNKYNIQSFFTQINRHTDIKSLLNNDMTILNLYVCLFPPRCQTVLGDKWLTGSFNLLPVNWGQHMACRHTVCPALR